MAMEECHSEKISPQDCPEQPQPTNGAHGARATSMPPRAHTSQESPSQLNARRQTSTPQASQDQTSPKKLHKNDPLWKVATILDELQKNSQRCWLPGKWLAIDKQTIGFKGAHGLALYIAHKREGDGYQCDAVCEDGYTFSFTSAMAMLPLFLQSTMT